MVFTIKRKYGIATKVDHNSPICSGMKNKYMINTVGIRLSRHSVKTSAVVTVGFRLNTIMLDSLLILIPEDQPVKKVV